MQRLHHADFLDQGRTINILPRMPQLPFPEHSHDFHELVLVKSGCGLHLTDGAVSHLSKGSIIYLPAEETHYFDRLDELCLTNVLFIPDNFGSKTVISFLQNVHRLGEPQFRIGTGAMQEAENLLENIGREYAKADEYSQAMVELLFAQLIVLLWREKQHTATLSSHGDDKALALITYIDEHFDRQLDFAELAEKFCLSTRTMTRRVQEFTGLPPSSYLGRIRLCHASRLLTNSDDSITDIAFSCGFNDSNYFSSRFHQEIGVTPQQFRRMQGLARDNGQISPSVWQ